MYSIYPGGRSVSLKCLSIHKSLPIAKKVKQMQQFYHFAKSLKQKSVQYDRDVIFK